MISLVLLTLTMASGVVDSERAQELMAPFEQCLRGNEATWVRLEVERCKSQEADTFKACAQSALNRIKERNLPTKEDCRRFLPGPGELLRDMA